MASIIIYALALTSGFLLVTLLFSKKKVNRNNRLEKFKKKRTTIKIKTSDFKILSNDYFEEVPKSEWSEVQQINGVFSENPTIHEERIQSQIILKGLYNGKSLEFHTPVLPIAEETLLFKIDKDFQFEIYFNKNNPSEYWINLSKVIDQSYF